MKNALPNRPAVPYVKKKKTFLCSIAAGKTVSACENVNERMRLRVCMCVCDIG